MTDPSPHPRRLWRSAGAVFLGLVAVVALSLGTDQPLGAVGLVLSTAGAIATIPMKLGPAWYPIALVLTALPCAWLGGAPYRRMHPER